MPRTEHPINNQPDVLRPCSTCKEEKPRTFDYFPKDLWMPDGLSVRCKACASKATLRSRAKRLGKDKSDAAPEGSDAS